MVTSEPPITRSVLQEELDRTLRHYATKEDVARLEGKFDEDMARLQGKMDTDLANLENRLTRWIAGGIGIVVIGIVANILVQLLTS